jgi:hypothetical protein
MAVEGQGWLKPAADERDSRHADPFSAIYVGPRAFSSSASLCQCFAATTTSSAGHDYITFP